ncbi:hypothetical protein [Aeromonas sp. MR7]|uniref:hypothetical protein n=1 Tax=Aeromonas sp. MR7 TaxID=2923419 RepID=UPI001F4A3607|nr:hypothetical protein [Aeromonas sp. MR7]MCH7347122.1 hypothetical protein [Aeromonas sp. MR7]
MKKLPIFAALLCLSLGTMGVMAADEVQPAAAPAAMDALSAAAAQTPRDFVSLTLMNQSSRASAYIEIIGEGIYDTRDVPAGGSTFISYPRGTYISTLRATDGATGYAHCAPVLLDASKTSFMNLETHSCYTQ